LDLDLLTFNLLYSIYSLPNILFPLFGGILVDYLGVKTVLVSCSILVVTGQSLFTIGVTHKSFNLALIGRGLFGCGGENLDLAQTIIVLRWFTGKELAFAFGLTSMSSLMGSVINDNIEPILVNTYGLNTGLSLGVLLCTLSLLATFLAIKFDDFRESITQEQEFQDFKLKNVYKFNRVFALLMVNTVCMECSIYCFSYIASGFLQDRFGYSSVKAGSVMSVSFFVSGLLSPLFGVLADRVGKRGVMMIGANGLVVGFHLFCMFCGKGTGTWTVVTAFVGLGIGFAIYVTVFWTSLSYVVRREVVGTAYGICYSIGNVALVVSPVVTGFIKEHTEANEGYFWVNAFLAALALVGMLSAYLVYSLDIRGEGVLNSRVPIESKALRSF